MKKYLSILTLILTTACVETVVVGATATGVVIAQDKSIVDTKDDLLITTQIDQKFIAQGLKNPVNKIGVTVDKQRVLLTGIVDDSNLVKKANEIAWKVSGVKEVIDEIQVKENKSLADNFVNYFKDVAITAQISSKALLDKNIASVNFEVVTINKVVYLIGTAQNSNEIKALSDIAAKTVGVKKVISHIILAKD
ncbi:MAG: BON domain-containing protein [Pseudomonadota bacterium]